MVRGTNWVGDAVMAVPALRELRCLLPDAHITLATRPGAADVFTEANFIDDLVIYDRRGFWSAFRHVRDWRRRRFDLAILLQNAFEAAAIAFLAGVPLRLGYATDARRALLTHPIGLPAWRAQEHEVFYYLNIVAEFEKRLLGTSAVNGRPVRYELSVSPKRMEQAHNILRKHGAQEGRPVLLLCPGSVNSRAKRWPADRYAALAERFMEAGADVALIGSASELEVSRKVCRQMRQQPIVLTGQTTVAEVIAVIGVADVLVTNDTGPAHIGAAVGTPTLVIFGPTNPLTTRPFSGAAEIIRHPPDCAPCMLRDCPIDHRCLTAITVAEVFNRASALLAAETGSRGSGGAGMRRAHEETR